MNKEQYVTITYYKEREFYFLNYAIQTKDGFIPKEMLQFHESEKEKFKLRIRELRAQYPNNHVVSISLAFKQMLRHRPPREESSSLLVANIFKSNYIIQENDLIKTIPTSLYFSPFAILYEQYKNLLNEKLILLIGYFDRKLFMMFTTKDKIHECWIIGTRGLSEKKIAERVNKTTKKYYELSSDTADHIEILVSEENPKLLKSLREELSVDINLAQNSIHQLLHHMGSSQKIAIKNYLKDFKEISIPDEVSSKENNIELSNTLDGVKIDDKDIGLVDKIKSMFGGSKEENLKSSILASILPMFIIIAVGIFYNMQDKRLLSKIEEASTQISAINKIEYLKRNTNSIFDAVDKYGEITKITLAQNSIYITGKAWGIPKLEANLKNLYKNGTFTIKTGNGFNSTIFTFQAK